MLEMIMEKNRKKGKSIFKKYWKIWFVFFIGLAIAIYPIVSNWYYTLDNIRQTEAFQEAVNRLSQEEVNERIRLAKAYNATLDPTRLSDPYTDEEKEGVANYARMLEVHEQIGYIMIPKIGQKIPVYAGTSEEVLQKAAGHLEGTSLPIGGRDTHSVITAHRGLPNVKLFRELNELQNGDIFYFTNVKETMAYQVDQIITVQPHEFEKILVVHGMDYMTLMTCTPYMINSHRLLVRGHRVSFDVSQAGSEQNYIFNPDFRKLMWASLSLLIIVVVLLVKRYRQNSKLKREIEGRSHEEE